MNPVGDRPAPAAIDAPAVGAGPELPHLAPLDGVRGVAILMVVFWHYYACVPRPEWVIGVPLLEPLAGYGWTGVPLFFVLSGFLIGRILMQQRGRPGYYRVFYLRRAARILPLYFLALGSFGVAQALLPQASHPALSPLFETDGPLWSYPLFTQNVFMALHGSLGGKWLGVTWSLAVEEQFYLLLPLLVAATPPAWLRRVALGLIAFAVTFRWLTVTAELGTPTALIVLLPSRIDAFAFGILLATTSRVATAGNRTGWVALFAVLLGAAVIHTFRSTSISYVISYYTMIAGAFAAVLWHVLSNPTGLCARALAAKPLVWMGSVSYFVYLFHEPANHLLHYAFRRQMPDLAHPGALGLTALALVLVLATAELSRRWFEGPIVAWGKRARYGTAAMTPQLAPNVKPALLASDSAAR